MGKKYIVEIGRLERLYKVSTGAKGMPNMTWLSPKVDLTPYTEPGLEQVRKEAYEDGYNAGFGRKIDASYQEGLADAWDAARKIVIGDINFIGSAFGSGTRSGIIRDLTASEVIKVLKDYEQKQDAEIKVGDEVVSENDIKAVVIDMDDYLLHVLDENGVVNGWPREDVAKTDRHFPEIAAVLEKMRGEQDG